MQIFETKIPFQSTFASNCYQCSRLYAMSKHYKTQIFMLSILLSLTLLIISMVSSNFCTQRKILGVENFFVLFFFWFCIQVNIGDSGKNCIWPRWNEIEDEIYMYSTHLHGASSILIFLQCFFFTFRGMRLDKRLSNWWCLIHFFVLLQRKWLIRVDISIYCRKRRRIMISKICENTLCAFETFENARSWGK